MFFGEQIPVAEEEEEEEEEDYTYPEDDDEEVRSPCSQGHRSSLRLKTSEGGSICILCFTNLISNPNSPSLHVSYALSQLSRAISNPSFLQNLRDFHVHLLISPLTQVLCNFDDEPIARQTIDLVSILCDSDDPTVCYDVIARIADRLSSGSLAWSRRQIYMLHSFGVLLNRQMDDPLIHIKEKGRLIANLVTGLQLPSEEVRGEILFVLYKLFMLQGSSGGGDDVDDLLVYCPKLLYLSLEALLKTQSDEVRLNCVALLTVLAQRGYLDSSCDKPSKISGEVNNFMQAAELTIDGMISLFAEAIKGPLLSSDSQVQIGTLDLIFYCLSREGSVARHTELLVEENIADYVFEILRLSGYKDPLVNSCLKVLGLLSLAEQAFNQRLTIGFPTLVPVLRHLSEVPFHPVQSHTLKLIWSCVSNFPGIVSRSQLEELALILTGMFQRHTNGEIGMLPETFTLGCSIFVAILKSPSSHGISTLPASAQEASRHAVLSCLCDHRKHPSELLLYSLYLLKETHRYSLEVNSNTNSNSMELANSIIEVCKTHLLPWITMVVDEMEEEDILGLIETFHSILLQGPEIQCKKFAEHIASSSWFSFSYGCLGLFPTEKMKWRVYLMLSSVVDGVLGHDSGQPIRDAALHLPPDPQDLLFLLGQKSCHDSDLLTCQSAILLILYTSSLYDERLAEEKQVLASLEQYILVNSSNFLSEFVDPKMLLQLVHLYSLYRSSAKISYQIPYSPEAEKLLFHLIVEKECDPLSARTHPLAVKWLFQQENITRPLCHNILNFCRSNSTNSTNRTEITVHGNGNSTVDLQTIAELVAAGDNFGAKLLVFLFKQLQEDGGQEEDITLVVNLMVAIINIFPETSEQLCLHGIGSAMHSLYYFSSYSSSPYIFVTCLLLIFNILRSVQTETLFDNDIWIPVATKLLEISTPKIVADKCNQEGLLVMAILSLILHHSTNIALEEISKAILLNTSLISTIKNIVQTSCAKGPALIDYDEETGNGQTLIFMLLLNFFSLRSLHSLPPGTVDWQYFLEPSDEAQPLSMICIHGHDLCRLIHFGSPPVKLVASHCMLELLTRISYQRSKNCHELNCSVRYLKSMMAVLEGLVFDNDIRVAINCALCISMILGWEKLGVKERRVIGEVKWCRLVVEELALSLAAPGLASESFTNQHKAATHVAVALLKLDQVPPWMRSVFDESCISGIVKNLSASSVSAEMVQLFRELLVSNYLKPDQISGLNHVFQACRKHVYTDSSQEGSIEECFEKVTSIPDDLDKVFRLLIRLMSTCSSPGMIPGGVQTENRRLLEEIDLFFHESSKRE